MDLADTVYEKRPWELTSSTLARYRMADADQAQQWYPPVIPRPDPLTMVPPVYGYRTDELGIADILDGVYSRIQDNRAFDDFSGANGGYQGTERNSISTPQGL